MEILQVVDQPRAFQPGELKERAIKVANYARDHPGRWVATNLIPTSYIKTIQQNNSAAFRPSCEWQTSTAGGISHVCYIGWIPKRPRQEL